MAKDDNPLKLKGKRELYCKEYLIDLNGTQAAIRAGYSEKTAYSIASELMRKPDIIARIKGLMDERSAITMVDACYVVENLKQVLDRCMQKTPVLEFDPVEKRLMQKEDGEGNGVWEFDSNGANRALELMGKHLAMFTDKSIQTTRVEQPLFPESRPTDGMDTV